MPLSVRDRGPGWSYRPTPAVDGAHQPGIATARLDHLVLAAYDLGRGLTPRCTKESKGSDPFGWGAGAAALMASDPGALTVTLGVGPALFERHGRLAERPVRLRELPPFPGDALDPALCGGDVVVQVCARTPEGAAAALWELTGGRAPRWIQTGTLRRGPHDQPDGTPRDPLGFRDGSGNIRRGRDRDRHVWVGRGDRSWMAGGTYMVVRRIEVDTAAWEALPEDAQERVIGRHKRSGAPLGRRWEFDPIVHADLPPDSHARLAAPSTNAGTMMLRRGYSLDGGGGIVFIAFVRDPHRQFVPVQRRLAEHDALSCFTRHTGSAVFAIPPMPALATR